MMALGGMDLTGGEVNVWRELRPHQFQNVSQCSFSLHRMLAIEYFHSHDKLPYWFTETKEDFCIKIEFFVLEHQYG